MAKTDAIDIVKIDREIAALDKEIKELQPLIQRRSDLQQLKMLATRLFGESRKAKKLEAINGHATARPKSNAELAFEALAEKGSMNLNELLAEMRSRGYAGSGVDATDKKRIYAAIYKNAHFERDDDKWEVKG